MNKIGENPTSSPLKNINTSEEVFSKRARNLTDNNKEDENRMKRPGDSIFTKSGLVSKQNPDNPEEVFQPNPKHRK